MIFIVLLSMSLLCMLSLNDDCHLLLGLWVRGSQCCWVHHVECILPGSIAPFYVMLLWSVSIFITSLLSLYGIYLCIYVFFYGLACFGLSHLVFESMTVISLRKIVIALFSCLVIWSVFDLLVHFWDSDLSETHESKFLEWVVFLSSHLWLLLLRPFRIRFVAHCCAFQCASVSMVISAMAPPVVQNLVCYLFLIFISFSWRTGFPYPFLNCRFLLCRC